MKYGLLAQIRPCEGRGARRPRRSFSRLGRIWVVSGSRLERAVQCMGSAPLIYYFVKSSRRAKKSGGVSQERS